MMWRAFLGLIVATALVSQYAQAQQSVGTFPIGVSASAGNASSGTVTSIAPANACITTTPNPITSTGTIAPSWPITFQNNSYTLAYTNPSSGDQCSTVEFAPVNGTDSKILTVNQSTSSYFPPGYGFCTLNTSSGTWTVEPTTSLIKGFPVNGSGYAVLAKNEWACFQADANNNYLAYAWYSPTSSATVGNLTASGTVATTINTSGGSVTVPDVTDTFDMIGTAQTISAVKTFSAAPIIAAGATVGIPAAGAGTIGTSANGLILRGLTNGAGCDVTLEAGNGDAAACVLTGTANVLFDGSIYYSGNATGAGNNILCFATSTALISYETSVAGCVPSDKRLKNFHGYIDEAETFGHFSQLHPVAYTWKNKKRFDALEHVGLYAQDVAKMDPRCASKDKSGEMHWDERCVIAYLVAAVQADHAEIAKLRAKIAR